MASIKFQCAVQYHRCVREKVTETRDVGLHYIYGSIQSEPRRLWNWGGATNNNYYYLIIIMCPSDRRVSHLSPADQAGIVVHSLSPSKLWTSHTPLLHSWLSMNAARTLLWGHCMLNITTVFYYCSRTMSESFYRLTPVTGRVPKNRLKEFDTHTYTNKETRITGRSIYSIIWTLSHVMMARHACSYSSAPDLHIVFKHFWGIKGMCPGRP